MDKRKDSSCDGQKILKRKKSKVTNWGRRIPISKAGLFYFVKKLILKKKKSVGVMSKK